MEPDLNLDLRDLNSSQKSHVCDICKKVFVSETDLLSHFKLHTGEKPYVNGQLDKTFAKKRTSNKNPLASTNKPHKCNECQKSFLLKSSLSVHQRVHAREKLHVCNVCQKTFIQASCLKNHQRFYAGKKPHVCNFCQKVFCQENEFKNHLLLHPGEKPHACKLCDQRFSLKCNLHRHLLTHTGEKPYVCDYCQKSFTQKGRFNHHVFHQHTHTSTFVSRPFVCKLCQTSFVRKTYLDRHVSQNRTNTSKRFPCNLCKISFSSKCLLHQHLHSHTENMCHVRKKTSEEDKQNHVNNLNFQVQFSTPLVGKLCQKPLSQKRDLNHSVSQNSDLKPVCSLCQKSFTSTDNFNLHLLSHAKKKYYVYQNTPDEGTADKLFFCKQCQQAFSEKAKLYQHLVIHTKQKPSVWDLCQKRLSQKKESDLEEFILST